MKQKFLLFANGRMPIPFSMGGDGYHIHNILKNMVLHNYKVTHLGVLQNFSWDIPIDKMATELKSNNIDFKFNWDWIDIWGEKIPSNRSLEYTYDNYDCKMFDVGDFQARLRDICEFDPPDILVTQLDGAREIIVCAKKYNIPVILFIIDADTENKYIISMTPLPDVVIFDSEFLKNLFINDCKSKYYVVHPVFDFEAQAPIIKKRQYISIVNPTFEKGGEIFTKIAQKLLNIDFLVQENWQELDSRIYSLPNVKFLKKTNGLREFYSLTKILLVPSICEDAFPTVIPLAQRCGIPVIGSNRGGIPEAIGEGGIIIDNPHNIDTWIKSIMQLYTNPSFYRKLAQNAKKNSDRFDSQKTFLSVLKIIEETNKRFYKKFHEKRSLK